MHFVRIFLFLLFYSMVYVLLNEALILIFLHLFTVGGPDRPVPQKEVDSRSGSGQGLAGSASGFVAGAAAVQANLYNRLASTMNERGCVILQES